MPLNFFNEPSIQHSVTQEMNHAGKRQFTCTKCDEEFSQGFTVVKKSHLFSKYGFQKYKTLSFNFLGYNLSSKKGLKLKPKHIGTTVLPSM